MLDQLHQQLDRTLADLVEILTDRGETGAEELRFRVVVETDEADVLGAAQPEFVHGAQRAECHGVVADEDGCDAGMLQHFEGCGVAGRRRPVAMDDRRHVRPGVDKGLLPAQDPLNALVPEGGARDVPDGAVPQRQKVFGGKPRTPPLIDAHHRIVTGRAGVDGDHRRQVGGVGAVAGHFRDQGLQQDHAVGGSRAQQVRALRNRRPVRVAQVGDRHGVAAIARGTLDTAQRGPRPVQGGVDGEHTYAAGAAAGQAPCHHVRSVVEGVHRYHYPFAGLRGDLGVAVDHPGHRHRGDTGQFGNVGERRGTVPGKTPTSGVAHGC